MITLDVADLAVIAGHVLGISPAAALDRLDLAAALDRLDLAAAQAALAETELLSQDRPTADLQTRRWARPC
jgi:hypothetical protein